jgi:hypothetical protein
MIEHWNRLWKIFRENDGSLPDIELDNLSGDEVISGYEIIRNSAARISSKEPGFWSTTKDTEVPFIFENNPAIDVISGEAECFHLCFDGITSPTGKAIPELGLFVFTDCLSFDYRMGPDWNIEAIEGLFELLLLLSKELKEMKLSHKNNINDEDNIFANAWLAYKYT